MADAAASSTARAANDAAQASGALSNAPEIVSADAEAPAGSGGGGGNLLRRLRRCLRLPRKATVVKAVSVLIRAVLVLELAGWVYSGVSNSRRRRGGWAASSEQGSSGDGADAAGGRGGARVLHQYLSGRLPPAALLGLGSDELIGAVEALYSDELDDLGVNDGGAELREFVAGIVEERRKLKDGKKEEQGGAAKAPAAAAQGGVSSWGSRLRAAVGGGGDGNGGAPVPAAGGEDGG